MWTSVTSPTVSPALHWHAPAPPCSWLYFGSVAVPPVRLPPLPPPPRPYPTPPAPPLRAPRPARPHWESPSTSGTQQSSSASSWCGERMSQECLCWICWTEAWQRRMADCGATTACWQWMNRTYATALRSRLRRLYRWGCFSLSVSDRKENVSVGKKKKVPNTDYVIIGQWRAGSPDDWSTQQTNSSSTA